MFNYINDKLADPRFMFIGLLSLALGSITAGIVTPVIIEGQDRKQCLTQDWPAHQHQASVEFCQYNGYEIGKLGPGF